MNDVIAHDIEALVARMQYQERECASADAPSYEVRCADLGVPPGSTIEGLPMGGCDVGLVLTEDVPAVVAEMLGPADAAFELWAVYEPTEAAMVTPSTFALMFAVPDDGAGTPQPVVQVTMRDEAIVGVFRTSCIEDIPAPEHVARWIVHPTDLGHGVPDSRP